jgi:putative transposase
MATELVSSAHSVGEANMHLQFTPAFRRAIFADPQVRELTIGFLLNKAHAMGVYVTAIEAGPDHVHLFVTGWRRYAPAELARQLKGYTGYMMSTYFRPLFKHLLWGNRFWSGGYFYRTVGAVNAETVKRYIEEGQEKHWVEEHARQQQTLIAYAG